MFDDYMTRNDAYLTEYFKLWWGEIPTVHDDMIQYVNTAYFTKVREIGRWLVGALYDETYGFTGPDVTNLFKLAVKACQKHLQLTSIDNLRDHSPVIADYLDLMYDEVDDELLDRMQVIHPTIAFLAPELKAFDSDKRDIMVLTWWVQIITQIFNQSIELITEDEDEVI